LGKSVAVIGAGSFGTALAKVLSGCGHNVTLWSFEQGTLDIIEKTRENPFLPGVLLPDNIKITCHIEEAVKDKEFIILATPSLFVLGTVKSFLQVPNIREGKSIIATITKGFIEVKSETSLIIEVLENYLPGFYKNNLVYLSGPSHAEEVASGKITGLISASPNAKNAIKIRELFAGSHVKVFPSLDVKGVQVCGAAKNVIAIAFGMMDAFKENSPIFGDNTESLLLAAGLNEIQQLGKAMGSTHEETFTSISGVGDLDVTCRSKFGRNRRFGSDIVNKGILENFSGIDDLISRINEIGYMPEGVMACKAALAIADKYNLKVPTVRTVYAILNKELEPQNGLMQMI